MRGLFFGTLKIPLPCVWAYEVGNLSLPHKQNMYKYSSIITSCSLACTQTHKIYCAPKSLTPSSSTDASHVVNGSNGQSPKNDVNGHTLGEKGKGRQEGILNPETLATSKELQELFGQYPQLRSQLRDIYKVTLEEAWVETQVQTGGHRPFGRGRGGSRRSNRGSWTLEKGFRRGLGRVRNLRERCEEGLETGRDAEGFMRFMGLVNGESQH